MPKADGKTGMVTILDPEKTVNLGELGKALKEHLPSYAIPLFLRLADALPMTGTFKVKKVELQREGFDLQSIKDPLYFYDLKQAIYVPLRDVYEDIISGKLKM